MHSCTLIHLPTLVSPWTLWMLWCLWRTARAHVLCTSPGGLGTRVAFTQRCCRWERLQRGCVEVNSNESIHWCWPAELVAAEDCSCQSQLRAATCGCVLAKAWGRQMLTEMIRARMDVPVPDRAQIFRGFATGLHLQAPDSRQSYLQVVKEGLLQDWFWPVSEASEGCWNQIRLFVLAQVKLPYLVWRATPHLSCPIGNFTGETVFLWRWAEHKALQTLSYDGYSFSEYPQESKKLFMPHTSPVLELPTWCSLDRLQK